MQDSSIVSKTFFRMQQIQPRLNRLVSNFAEGAGQEPGELMNDIFLVFLSRQVDDASFLEQKDAYLVCAAKFAALHAQEHYMTQRRHITSSPAVRNSEQDELEGDWFEEMLPDESPDPETAVMMREDLAETIKLARQLSPSNQKIVRLLLCGYGVNEIADMLGVSAPAISQRKKLIAEKLGSTRMGELLINVIYAGRAIVPDGMDLERFKLKFSHVGKIRMFELGGIDD